MDKYTIYCTEKQTEKAVELGAPLVFIEEDDNKKIPQRCIYVARKWGYYVVPTAEQMLGWLDSQTLQVTVRFRGEDTWYYNIMSGLRVVKVGIDMDSRKEAVLAGIDSALDYLVGKKEGL